jgi:ribonuclease HI
MRRLDQFPGFLIGKSSSASVFNPFGNEIEERTSEILQKYGTTKPIVKTFQNILDSPAEEEAAPSVIPALFPQSKPKPVPLKEVEHEPTPMIQPRSKEGQRLLYRHPNLPRVGPQGKYSLLVGQADRSQTAWLMQFDGAANPNPGPASSGAVLWSPADLSGKRNVVFEVGKFLGKATNNIAEAQGLLLGLKQAATRGARDILIEGDSELNINQQIGKYKVSDRNLKVWWSEAQAAMMDEASFDWVAIRHVYREENERADSITKEVLSRKEGFQRGS